MVGTATDGQLVRWLLGLLYDTFPKIIEHWYWFVVGGGLQQDVGCFYIAMKDVGEFQMHQRIGDLHKQLQAFVQWCLIHTKRTKIRLQ